MGGGLAACAVADSDEPTDGEGLSPGTVPSQYEDLVNEAGSTCATVTPPAIAAQIEAESNWTPDAVSSAGAQGISQFMPATWDAYGRDENGDGVADPLDPEDAIPAQGRYMCEIAGMIEGWIESGEVAGDALKLTFAGYNAGPGAVQEYGGIPPYPETQAYVEKIMTLIDEYAADDNASPPDGGGGPVVSPVAPGTYSSDNYGDTGGLWSSYHTGNDFSAACGAPIYAATAGTVNIVYSGEIEAWYGYEMVQILTGPNSVRTDYAHLLSIEVEDGQAVTAGQRIGQAGAEGNVTGCHLHFEYYPTNGAMYEDDADPVQWLEDNGVEVG